MSQLKPIAFYLPQYHRVKENDEWWGPGFTEWTNVAKGKPNFQGHYQPHIPKHLGFYNLENVEIMREQAKLAKEYGVYGFCFYYYRFKDGKRILEKPLDNYLASDIDFPFCYCWANENWTRTWDGLDREILLEQSHNEDDDINFLKELIPTFHDARYIKVDGKPVLLVYRADLIKNTVEMTKKWREIAKEAGFPDIHLCAVEFYGVDDPTVYGFDRAVEFPPHKYIGSTNCPDYSISMTNKNFRGGIIDYRKVISQSINRERPGYTCYRGIIPSWDNTARRQDTSVTIVESNPKLYKFWLSFLAEYTEMNIPENEQFIFINAWNEWAEGAHLEPDQRYGLSYLEATLQAVNKSSIDIKDYFINENLLKFIFSHMTDDEKQELKNAFRIVYSDIDSTDANNDNRTICDNERKRIRFRDYLRDNHPNVHALLVKIYTKLSRKF